MMKKKRTSSLNKEVNSLHLTGGGYFPEDILLQKMKKAEYSSKEEFSVKVPSELKEVDELDNSEDEEEEEEQGEPSKPLVTNGFHSVKGKMDHGMEDYIVAENRKINGIELGLYAIFDGHSGREVAEFLQPHLFDNILSEPDFWRSPKMAIKRAYKVTDDEFLDKVVGSRGGSTAVTAILINREKLIVANIGDSQAILCRNGAAKPITVDHEPQNEKDLVESRGGYVLERPGNMDTDSIILASDGLWKVMSNQEALDCIKDLDNAQEASDKLIEEALSRRSLDDISCIVVMFQ